MSLTKSDNKDFKIYDVYELNKEEIKTVLVTGFTKNKYFLKFQDFPEKTIFYLERDSAKEFNKDMDLVHSIGFTKI